jgi:hypothetical protein
MACQEPQRFIPIESFFVSSGIFTHLLKPQISRVGRIKQYYIKWSLGVIIRTFVPIFNPGLLDSFMGKTSSYIVAGSEHVMES